MKDASTRHSNVSWATLLLILFSAAWSRGQSQPSQAPDLQQLKDKLQQLEQTMQELKGQINALEKTQAASVQPASAALEPQQ